MRVGEPARKHGIPDEHMHHALRNAARQVLLDDDLTMVIGPSPSGALLEIGVLYLGGDDAVVIRAMPLRTRFYRLL